MATASVAGLPGASASDLAPSLDLLRRCIDRMAAAYGYASEDVGDAIVNVRRAANTSAILDALDATDLSAASALSSRMETQRVMAQLTGGVRGG